MIGKRSNGANLIPRVYIIIIIIIIIITDINGSGLNQD